MPNEPKSSEEMRWPNLPVCTTHCRTYRVRVETERIGYVNAILEGYEWLARIQTEDKGQGILSIDVPRDWDEMFHGAMRGIAERVEITFLDDSCD